MLSGFLDFFSSEHWPPSSSAYVIFIFI
jgi:hypothetical protein